MRTGVGDGRGHGGHNSSFARRRRRGLHARNTACRTGADLVNNDNRNGAAQCCAVVSWQQLVVPVLGCLVVLVVLR